MITPFTKDGTIDFKALEAQIAWYIVHGCDGLFTVCQSSEMFFLSLEERLALARACVDIAAGRLPVVACGNLSCGIEEQIEEIGQMWATGVDAVVLLSNHLATQQEDDDVWISNAQAILDEFPHVTFGMYECPMPYQRLISNRGLQWMIDTGRFAFLKDTCCDASLIRERLEQIKASGLPAAQRIRLFNANTMTLLASLLAGADGYCGVMGNFHPELYQWLVQHYKSDIHSASILQASLTLLSNLENQAYPICAKKHMQNAGICMTLNTRAIGSEAFGETQQEVLRQSQLLESSLRKQFKLEETLHSSWLSSASPSVRWCEDKGYPFAQERHADVRRSVIHMADSAYPFLHDTMIVHIDGRLLCAWYNSSKGEIAGETVIRGKWSMDEGRTWSEPEIIAQAEGGSASHLVPAVFVQTDSSHGYAYVTEMIAHDRPVGFHTYQYEGGTWRQLGFARDPLLFNSQPILLPDGRLVSAGRTSEYPGGNPLLPCVMFRSPKDPCQWAVRILPGPWHQGHYPLSFPETALMTSGDHFTAITRNDKGRAQVFESHDAGVSWTGPHDCGLPIGPSKICAGSLSTGYQYLIYNERTPTPGRERLVIAVRSSDRADFDRVITLFDGKDENLNVGPMWHYPCGMEYQGALYVSCTASQVGDVRRHAALAVVPMHLLL